MTRQLPDAADRQGAVVHCQGPVVVEAAAGTGKTTLLVNRILHMLLSGPDAPSMPEIAAITFTEKAAAEMKLRLRDRIEAVLRSGEFEGQPLSAAQRRALEEALAQLELAQISTIHSFCLAILRERPVEAGLDPEVVMADGIEQRLLWEDTWRRWVERHLSHAGQPEANPLGRALIDGAQLYVSRYAGHVTLPTAGLAAVMHRDVFRGEPVDTEWKDLTAAWIRDRSSEAQQWLAHLHPRRNPTQVTRFLQAIVDLHSAVQQDLPEEELRRLVSQLADSCPRSKTKLCVNGKDCSKEVHDFCKLVADEARALCVLETVNELVMEFGKLVNLYEERKRNRKVLDFLDLLIRVRDLLEHGGVRDYFCDRYRHLLVDEFQDTDPLQAEIIEHLLRATKPPHLFIVGDPKQSIYRFRRADIETYRNAVEALGKQGASFTLRCNFRSAPAILEFVNRVFEPHMDGNKDPYQADYVALEPAPAATAHDRAGVYVLWSGEPEPKENVDEQRRREGYAIASFIKRAVEEQWPVGADRRPMAYSDVAVLLEQTTGLEHYEYGFQAAGLPYRIVGAKQFFQRIELKTILNILRAIDRSTSPAAVVAAVRSPVFGVSDADLADHVLRGGTFSYLTRQRGANEKVSQVFEVLRALYSQRNRVPVHVLLEDVLRRTGAVEFFAALPRGADRAASILHLLDEAQRLANAGISFKRFVEWLDQRTASTEEETDLPQPEGLEAIQVITIHRAKGLEFPMVVVAGLEAKRNERVDPPVVDRTTQQAHFRFSSGLWTMGWPEAERREKQRQRAERVRLFYVACTRAKDYLVLPIGWYKPDRTSLSSFLPPVFKPDKFETVYQGQEAIHVDGLEVRVVCEGGWRRLPPVSRAPRVQIGKVTQEAQEILRKAGEFEQGWGEAKARSRKGLEIVRPSELDEVAVSQTGADREAEEAAALGKLTHLVLQVAVDEGLLDQLDGLRERARSWARSMGLGVSAADEALQLARRASRCDRFRDLLASGTAHTEVPVVGVVQQREEGKSSECVVEGIVDLLILKDGGRAIIVDYKTDALEPGDEERLLERYRRQLQAYAAVVRQRFSSVEAYLLALHTGSLVPVPLS